jgi:hypothetical protein
MSDAEHLKGFGITVDNVQYDRAAVAAHAKQLVGNVQKNLGNSLTALGVDIIPQSGIYAGPNKVQKAGTNEFVTAKNIILAPGSVPFVPPGIQIDGKTVFTSDDSLKLEWVPNWVAIIGSGYIGLEFSDVYTALGSEVTFIEAMDTLMPTFDPEIRRVADRMLIQPRKVDGYTSVFATEVTPGEPGKKPVKIKLVDAKTKAEIPDSPLYVDAALVCTGRVPNTKSLGLDAHGIETVRGFVQVDRVELQNAHVRSAQRSDQGTNQTYSERISPEHVNHQPKAQHSQPRLWRTLDLYHTDDAGGVAGEREDAGARQGRRQGGAGPVVHRRRQRQDDACPRRLRPGPPRPCRPHGSVAMLDEERSVVW